MQHIADMRIPTAFVAAAIYLKTTFDNLGSIRALKSQALGTPLTMSPSALGHIKDPEFEGLGLEELNENEFQRCARSGMPLLLPWHRKPVRLGTGYHSRLQTTDEPWAQETPFVLADLLLQAKVYRTEQGTTSSFTSRKTSRTAETNDHLALGFGVGISPPIPICSASVKGNFDRQLQENSDVSSQDGAGKRDT